MRQQRTDSLGARASSRPTRMPAALLLESRANVCVFPLSPPVVLLIMSPLKSMSSLRRVLDLPAARASILLPKTRRRAFRLAVVFAGASATLSGLTTAARTDAADRPPVRPPQAASKPLFRDPIFDGAADPVVIWNPHVKRWWMFYTNRRANVAGLSGVAWVHGTKIGIAESDDGGTTWRYLGTADIKLPPEIGGTEPTLWAPDVVTVAAPRSKSSEAAPGASSAESGNPTTYPNSEVIHHMFLTVVPGVFENWQHPRTLVHLTSTDLLHWSEPTPVALASDRVIDACVHPLPDGTWRMWYNNERDHKSIYYADSPDLTAWTDRGKCACVGERPGEGPFVFAWKGRHWMLVDFWKGLGVYASDDLLNWTAQAGDLLGIPGKGTDDGVNGGHPGVVVSGDRAFCFYFTHPGRAGTIRPEDKDSLELRRSSIQVVELFERDGQLTCDRDEPTYVELSPPR